MYLLCHLSIAIPVCLSQGWAAGHGTSNGSYKGHQLFTCPEHCALFVPVSELSQRSRSSGSTADHETSPGEPTKLSVLARAAESTPPRVGQKVWFTQDRVVYWGTVQFCGLLPGRNSTEVSVALLLVSWRTAVR